MADFNVAVDKLIIIEGGFVNNPNDSGGATKYGISLRFFKETINPNATIDTIKNLTISEAQAIYLNFFWNKYRIGEIKDQTVAEKIFNMFVNLAPKAAAQIVQAAINSVANNIIKVDGIMGSQTIAVLNQVVPQELLAYISLKLIKHYCDIVDAKESQITFLLGWVKRALA